MLGSLGQRINYEASTSRCDELMLQNWKVIRCLTEVGASICLESAQMRNRDPCIQATCGWDNHHYHMKIIVILYKVSAFIECHLSREFAYSV